MVKGCIDIGAAPDIENTINMAPVDYVAHLTALAAFSPSMDNRVAVFHVTSSDLFTFTSLMKNVSAYGYPIQLCDYPSWRRMLEAHLLTSKDSALFPLSHLVLNDFQTNSKAPRIDDTNTMEILRRHSVKETTMFVTPELLGIYLAWLVGVGVLPPASTVSSRNLPNLLNGATKAAGRHRV
jgi:L-aminoadipate-semialdehyde dehydrogenase